MIFWSRSLRTTVASDSPCSTRTSARCKGSAGTERKILWSNIPADRTTKAAEQRKTRNKVFTYGVAIGEFGVTRSLSISGPLIFRKVDLHPSFDLTHETGKWIFSRRRCEVSLPRIVEGTGVVLELF